MEVRGAPLARRYGLERAFDQRLPGRVRGGRLVRVLGVDPGLTRCGVGVVDGGRGRQLQFVRVGVIHTPAELPFEQRLLAVAEGLEQAIESLAPDLVAVERVFSQHNVRTVMATAQTAGLAVVAATRVGIPVVLHTPSEVKAAVTGSGAAGKAQVTTMVSRLLGLPEAPRPADAADALALAICAIWRGQAMALRQAAVARVASAAVASR